MSVLLELPLALQTHIFRELSARDLGALCCTCRALKEHANQDLLWRRLCEAWLEAQRVGTRAEGLDADQLLHTFRLPTFRLLCHTLHGLGTWPAGVWYATSQGALPCGRLLVVQPHADSGALLLQRPVLKAGPDPSVTLRQLRPALCLKAVPNASGMQAQLDLTSSGQMDCTLQLSQEVLLVHHHFRQAGPLPLPGMRTVRGSADQAGGMDAALTGLAQYLSMSPVRVRLGVEEYRRAAPAPALPPPQGEGVGMALLWEYQGLWSGSYGPHGIEVLRLTASSASEEVPPLCPITGPRLQGLKLCGDPNVPALKHSFVVDALSCLLGPYNPQADDPFAPGQGPARPVLTFSEAATAIVDISSRPVRARFSATGCINVVPGLWQPEWVPAQLLLYSAPLDRILTLIFLDQGEPFMHAIDFEEFPFAQR
ncbi:hypothetical protein D9Q98_000747 [Chlorella vulgaris]|uniref:F-box domain-containing protein n=1 Tax=Chlorella vulgaris TaxID=3077 RepID=A0A9D4TYV4_CHLVU|nr:hypothetical protein D9Q98_000747 [Chlorella vulgaris]